MKRKKEEAELFHFIASSSQSPKKLKLRRMKTGLLADTRSYSGPSRAWHSGFPVSRVMTVAGAAPDSHRIPY